MVDYNSRRDTSPLLDTVHSRRATRAHKQRPPGRAASTGIRPRKGERNGRAIDLAAEIKVRL